MKNSEYIIQHFNGKIGGQWSRSMDQDYDAFRAEFPRFQAETVAGVLNSIAEDLGHGRPVSLHRTGASLHLRSDDPNSRSEVAIPPALAQSTDFQQAVDGARETVSQQLSQNISRMSFNR